jgi:hypothetical protein
MIVGQERYPDKIRGSDGKDFENLVEALHRQFFGEDIGIYRNGFEQLTIGESHAGVECKELKKSFNRLHIEIAERTSASGNWFPSGIYSKDNATRYVCGNDEDIFAFAKPILIAWHQKYKPEEIEYPPEGPTIRSAVLQKRVAEKMCLYRFIRVENDWVLNRQSMGMICEMIRRNKPTDAP